MSKVLVSVSEREWIRDHASIEMGKVVKYKVIDINKVVSKIREDRKNNNLSPYVDIVPISADQHKVPNKMPTFQKDPITGVFYGLAVGEDEYGNIRWQRIQIGDSLALNLDNEMDAKIWAVIRFNSDIQGSPFQKQTPYYKIFDPVETAKAEYNEIQEMKQAFDRVEQMKKDPKTMVFFARYLGEDLRENTNLEILVGTLLKYAKNTPYEFNSKYLNRNRAFAEKFHSGLALGIIEQHPDRGYVFRNVPIGYTEEECIKTFSTDQAVMTAVNLLILERDIVTRMIVEGIEDPSLLEKYPFERNVSGTKPGTKFSKKPVEKKAEPETVEVIQGKKIEMEKEDLIEIVNEEDDFQ